VTTFITGLRQVFTQQFPDIPADQLTAVDRNTFRQGLLRGRGARDLPSEDAARSCSDRRPDRAAPAPEDQMPAPRQMWKPSGQLAVTQSGHRRRRLHVARLARSPVWSSRFRAVEPDGQAVSAGCRSPPLRIAAKWWQVSRERASPTFWQDGCP
jgi:hypothetical protein